MSITINRVYSPSPILGDRPLRRQLYAELLEVQSLVSKSGFSDEMTKQIAFWQKNFLIALHSSFDEEAVCNAYISLLQEMLTDPITNAPLDAYAVLGNDGYTYGQMSLAVYKLSFPQKYQNRSPLDVENEEDFKVVPHKLVRHMIGWLVSHDAPSYSGELEKTYLDLLRQRSPIDRQKRIDRLLSKKVEKDRNDAKRLEAEFAGIENKLKARVEDWSKELEKEVSGLESKDRFSIPKMEQDEERLRAKEEAARENLKNTTDQIERGFSRLDEGLNGLSDPYSLEEQELKAFGEEERSFIAGLRERVQGYVNSRFEPLAERIKANAKENSERIKELSSQDLLAMHQVEQLLEKMQVEIDDLTQKNQELEKTQQDVSGKIDEAKRQHIDLDRSIGETRKALVEMKKRQNKRLLVAVAIIGACCIATWGLNCLLAGTAFKASVAAKAGGAALKVSATMSI